MRTFKIYCLSNFQIYSAASLAIVTMLYIPPCDRSFYALIDQHPLTGRPPYIIIGKLYHLGQTAKLHALEFPNQVN